MEKKRDLKPIIIIILIIILVTIIFLYNKEDTVEISDTTVQSTEETSEAKAEVKTITNTISSSGEITTALSEKLQLHATYYFEEIYFSEGDKVLAGENILKYTNETYMTAPYDLVIVSTSVPETLSQCTNSHYIEVYAINSLTINLSVSEEELDKVYVGQEVSIIPTINEEKTYTGYITDIQNTGTYSSNGSSYKLTATFENDGELKVGMSATADIILEKSENVVVVPNEAIQTSETEKYVVVVEKETTKNVTVEVGISNDAYTEIKSGISEGETVQIVKQESTTKNNQTNRMMNRN